jgi:hypothetical protein
MYLVFCFVKCGHGNGYLHFKIISLIFKTLKDQKLLNKPGVANYGICMIKTLLKIAVLRSKLFTFGCLSLNMSCY